MRISLTRKLLLGFGAALLALGGVTAFTLASIQHIADDTVQVSRAREAWDELGHLWRLTAERSVGFAGAEAEIAVSLASLHQIIPDGSVQQQRLSVLESDIAQRAPYEVLSRRFAEMTSEQRAQITARSRRTAVRWFQAMAEIVLTCLIAMLAVAWAGYATRREVRERDRAERNEKAARNLLDSVMDGCGAAVYAKDLEGRLLMVNRYAALLLGRDAQALRGKTMADLLPPDVSSVLESNNRKVLESGQPMEFEETLVMPGDPQGKPRTYLSVLYPLVDEKGATYGLCGVSSDITTRKDAELALTAAKDAAEQASRFKNQFLATVSHELRAPINSVLGFSELLGDPRVGLLNARQLRYVDNIRAAGHRMVRLINEFLDMSKIESGRLEVALEPVPLDAVIRDVLNSMRPQADKKSLQVSTSLGEGIVVCADSSRLWQVMTNLVGNAVKFTPECGFIRVSATQDQGHATVEVLDSGPGIAHDEQARVFESFYRAQGAIRQEGTGLGLAISKRLIEAQGGDFGLSSEPGRGCRFYFTLPVHHVALGALRHEPRQ